MWRNSRGEENERRSGEEEETRGKEKLRKKDETAVYCRLWRPLAVEAEEFVSLWWNHPVYFSSLPPLAAPAPPNTAALSRFSTFPPHIPARPRSLPNLRVLLAVNKKRGKLSGLINCTLAKES